MPDTRFDRFYRYEELTELLHAYAREYPHLVRVESIGKSHEGRDVWLATVTDTRTGPPEDKPAFWCDGNIHAAELSASTAVLHILHTLATDPARLPTLAERTFYLVPRINPDGAEWALETPPRFVRSSTRPYPYAEEDPYGLEQRDLDGDGRVLSMRVPDPNGPYKVSETEPRLMERRLPGERGGSYYRVLPEGVFHHWDGVTFRPRLIQEGLDMNRNFPTGWQPEHVQFGSGPFPASEPEVRAVMRAIVDRPNITGAVAYHTFNGANVRPPNRMFDADIPAEDLWTYQTIGDKGLELTGYPALSNYQQFRAHPQQVTGGVFDDWMYEHLGVYAWTTEIWSPQRQAGIGDYLVNEWLREHPFEHDVQLLKWSDEVLGGLGYKDWTPFEHPQLGPVEIGGWDTEYAFRNPPPAFLEAEVARFVDWVEWQANLGPRLGVRVVRIDPVDSGMSRIVFAVQNTGWLPTNVTKQAETLAIVRGVVGEISREGESGDPGGAPRPAWLVSGQLRVELGQLLGWNHVPAPSFVPPVGGAEDVGVFEWVVAPGTYRLQAHHPRAGRVERTVTVE